MTEVLPLYLRRKLAGTCTRCGAPADADANLCRDHLEDQRKRVRASDKKRRDALRKARKCIDCRSPSKKLRCRSCGRLHRDSMRDRRGAYKIDRGANTQAPIPDPTWRADSDGWVRYRGRARRGPPEIGTLDGQDLDYAADAIGKAKAGFELTRTAAVTSLPRIQREAADREWLAYLDLAERFFDEVRARHRIKK